MVADIKTGRSLGGALAYNERKVAAGEAELLGAVNSLADASRQSLGDKTRSLQQLADRTTTGAKRTAFHISLSFAQSDRLTGEQLRGIAGEFLEGIGFGGQPGYVYRHRDTANDHIHIVTTNIRADGSRIKDSWIGATKGMATSRALERKYGLVDATKVARARGVGEGTAHRADLKAHARSAVGEVLSRAKPADVGDLNALLRPRGVKVTEHRGRGRDGAEYLGYTFRRTGPEGEGASVKASRVFEPGWAGKLEQTLAKNAAGKAKAKARVRSRVERAFAAEGLDAEGLRSELRRGGVEVVEHRGDTGRLYGVSYVSKAGYVYKASEIGRAFSAAAWSKREGTGALGAKRAETLAKALDRHMRSEAKRLGTRSAAMRAATPERLRVVAAEAGIEGVGVGEALRAYAARLEAARPKQIERDREVLGEVQRGIERLELGYRASVARAAGFARDRDGDYYVHEEGIRLRRTRGAELDDPGVGGVTSLSEAERTLLRHVGRGRGMGSLPRWVDTSSIDWDRWGPMFETGRRASIEARLRGNRLAGEVTRATRAKDPAALLASRGFLVRPVGGGYEVYEAGAPDTTRTLDADRSARTVAARLAGAGYDERRYRELEAKLRDAGVREAIAAARALEGRGRRQRGPGGDRDLRSLRGRISRFIRSGKARMGTGGLTELLRRGGGVDYAREEDERRRRGRGR